MNPGRYLRRGNHIVRFVRGQWLTPFLSLVIDLSAIPFCALRALCVWSTQHHGRIHGGLTPSRSPCLFSKRLFIWLLAIGFLLPYMFGSQQHNVAIGCCFIRAGLFDQQDQSLARTDERFVDRTRRFFCEFTDSYRMAEPNHESVGNQIRIRGEPKTG